MSLDQATSVSSLSFRSLRTEIDLNFVKHEAYLSLVNLFEPYFKENRIKRQIFYVMEIMALPGFQSNKCVLINIATCCLLHFDKSLKPAINL